MIHPNLHPPLVHFPLALLMTGATIEILSFLGWRNHPIRAAARWMILLGTLASVGAITSGIYALNQAARTGISARQPSDTWHDVITNSPLIDNAGAWTLMVRHVWLESIAVAVLLLTVNTWIASTDRNRQRFHAVWAIGLIVGVGLIGGGAYFSGEGVYTHAVGVTTAPVEDVGPPIDPLELHLVAAGITIALSTLAIAICCRGVDAMQIGEPINEIAAALGGTSSTATFVAECLPVWRISTVAAVIGLLTFLGGWYVLASGSVKSVFAFHDLWSLISDPEQNEQHSVTRRLAHVIAGGLIVFSPIVLASAVRLLPRQRWLRFALTTIVLLVIAAQIWLGILLLFDGNSGPVTRLMPADSAAAERSP